LFRGHEFILRPETEDNSPSLVIETSAGFGHEQACQVAYEFLSVLSWVNQTGIVERFSVFSTAAPMAIGKRECRLVGGAPPQEYLPSPDDPRARLALALYREGLSANMVTYRFLAFFKIINMLHRMGQDQQKWINDTLSKITDYEASTRVAQISKTVSDIGKYLYVSGRCSVAHAFSTPVANPDSPQDIQRLRADLPVMQALAEYAIENEFGVKSVSTILREHLYELQGFREILGEAIVAALKCEDTVPPGAIQIPERLSLRLKGRSVYSSFEAMKAQVLAAEHGTVSVGLETDDSLMKALLLLHFRHERLTFNAMEDVIVSDDGTTRAARLRIDHLSYLRDWLSNGIVEVWQSASEKRLGRSEVVVPRNVWINWRYFDEQIEQLKERAAVSAARP